MQVFGWMQHSWRRELGHHEARLLRGALATCASLAFATLATSATAAPPVLFHSPADDGVSGGIPAQVPTGLPVTLHLYLDGGATPSTADPCLQGDGDEVCGFLLHLQGAGMDLQSFTPATGDTLFNLASPDLQLTGGDFAAGDLGPTKVGDLVVEGPSAGGTLSLVVGDAVTADLAKELLTAPEVIVELPEPGGPLPLALGSALLGLLGSRRRA